MGGHLSLPERIVSVLRLLVFGIGNFLQLAQVIVSVDRTQGVSAACLLGRYHTSFPVFKGRGNIALGKCYFLHTRRYHTCRVGTKAVFVLRSGIESVYVALQHTVLHIVINGGFFLYLLVRGIYVSSPACSVPPQFSSSCPR